MFLMRGGVDLSRWIRQLRETFDLRESLRAFFEAVPGALRNHLNTDELVRITITSLMAGVGLLGLLQAVVLNVGVVFPAPTDAALAGVAATFLLECLRRLGHGQELSTVTLPRMRLPRRDGGGS